MRPGSDFNGLRFQPGLTREAVSRLDGVGCDPAVEGTHLPVEFLGGELVALG